VCELSVSLLVLQMDGCCHDAVGYTDSGDLPLVHSTISKTSLLTAVRGWETSHSLCSTDAVNLWSVGLWFLVVGVGRVVAGTVAYERCCSQH
jgi:hypothetical protein